MFELSDYEPENLYVKAHRRGRWGRVWSTLTGRSHRLLALSEIDAVCTARADRHAAVHTVQIDRIRGSQDRCNDFDHNFCPLQKHNQHRWLSVARARGEGKSLPPVELVQVGDVFFVRDGHHRISVARALGQREIEAEVTVWQVSGPLPPETQVAAPQATGLARL